MARDPQCRVCGRPYFTIVGDKDHPENSGPICYTCFEKHMGAPPPDEVIEER
jgi:hypothetical protein